MKKISIIIPHYNSWDKLKELLETIPDNDKIEVIVVDDHSKDNNKQIMNMKNRFPNFNIIINDNNKKGAGAARNVGLRYATGEWLLFADSDDIFLPGLMENLVPFLDSNYDLIFYSPASFNDTSSETSERHRYYDRYVSNYIERKSLYNELKLRYYFVVPWSKLIRHNIVKENNIQFEEIMVSNDILFSAKIGRFAKEIFATKQKIYSVRQSQISLTSITDEDVFRQRFRAWIDYITFIKENISTIELKELHISAIPQLLSVYKNNLGIKNFFYVIKNCKKNNIPLFDNRVFNFRFLLESLKFI